jgi:LysR family transcriptional regulator for bpeEF and oprC
MDRFFALTIFTKVVEAGGFSAAARQLDLSPASVTEQVQALEKHLKTRLLNRTTRSVALTDEGAAYYEHACQILARMDEADAMLTAQRTSPKGMLRVAMPQMLGTLIVLPAMPAFLRQYPEMRVEFTLNAQAPSFAAQNLDLALQVTAEIEPGLVFRPIGLCRIWTMASPEYLARRGTPSHPDDLADHDVIGVRAVPGVPLSTLRFERDGKLVSRPSNARVIADSGVAQRVLALAGGGVFQGAEYGVSDLVESGQLVRIMQDWEWSGPPLGAVHPPNRFLQPRVGVFLEFVQQLLKDKVSPYRADWLAP